jgi:hypothetical protein
MAGRKFHFRAYFHIKRPRGQQEAAKSSFRDFPGDIALESRPKAAE